MMKFFYQLDVHVEEGKSAQAKKQMKKKVLADCPSSQSSPGGQCTNPLIYSPLGCIRLVSAYTSKG